MPSRDTGKKTWWAPEGFLLLILSTGTQETGAHLGAPYASSNLLRIQFLQYQKSLINPANTN